MKRAAASAAGLCGALLWAAACGPSPGSAHKVYAMLGFHSNFYHSWRGDTPDEAGFGTDIRLVRFLIGELDRANAEGLDARAYWDHDNLFTLETILPVHAPDVIDALRRRVGAGLDEIVLGAYANGLTGAMTREELRATTDWAISNPWGSGVRDIFGTYTPVLRPQEGMLTTGSIPLLRAGDVQAVVLAYSEWPFNAFSNFVPPLAPGQRYGVTWLRLRDGGPRIPLLPAMSIGDVLNHISFERWLLDLREMQVRGEVDRDLVLHMNFDSDVDSWIPQELPPGLGWLPNAGGLREYIEAVNKYDWAEFTTPGEFLAEHEPVGDVVVRQDTADGAYDGHASWAEKFPSHAIWTQIERSRLAGRRAEAWLAALVEPPTTLVAEVRGLLYEGRESSFFLRLRGLSTTHFGMSTPVLNEERQAVAERLAAAARAQAEEAERRAARQAAAILLAGPEAPGEIAEFAVRDLRSPGAGGPATCLVRLPFLFEADLPATRLVDSAGRDLPHSWLNPERLGDTLAVELWTLLELEPGEGRTLSLRETDSEPPERVAGPASVARLANDRLVVQLGETGIAALRAGDWEVGDEGFLAPFVTYRAEGARGAAPRTFAAEAWIREPLGDERRDGVARARLATKVPFETPDGRASARLRVDLTLPKDAPWLIADVHVVYPHTRKRDLLHTHQQKLRRYLDRNWIEVGPFPITPRLEGSREAPLVVWKHNFLDITASFPLDYGQINPRNAELDAFNHQITAGWVAVSDRTHGLLLADRADVRTSFAFSPMRLRERDGRQLVSLNPFGTYHGRQLAYDHLGGNGVGTAFTTLASSAVRPNGPSYNGESERFSLLIAPYEGDAPPERLRADAQAFFHPPAVVVRSAEGTRLPGDLRAAVEALSTASAQRRTGPLPPPLAFLANPTDGAVDLVWDEPRDPRIAAYEIEWRESGEPDWKRRHTRPANRHRFDGLTNGSVYAFRLRALGGGTASDWTETLEVRVEPVERVELIGLAGQAPIGLLLRTFWYGLVHVVTTL